MTTPIRCAFVGFHHPHGWAIWNRLKRELRCQLVAACEEDAETRASLRQRDDMPPIYDDMKTMLVSVDVDVVATADVYGRRGRVVIEALQAGCHVLADKPICTTLAALERIEALVAQTGLSIGCELDLRAIPQLQQARALILSREIGDIHAVQFGGQHPTLCYQRADWYLNPALYGGVINDIGIHGIDAVQWLTGMEVATVSAARNWAAFRLGGRSFPDAAQMMLVLENGGGVLGDVSFISPDSFRFSLPYYWEFTFWGTGGVLRVGLNRETIELYRAGRGEPESIQRGDASAPDYFSQFLHELDGSPVDLTTKTILAVTRKTLRVQRAADEKRYHEQL